MSVFIKVWRILSTLDRLKYIAVLFIRICLVGLDLAGVAAIGLTMSLISNVTVSNGTLTYNVVQFFNSIGLTNVALAIAAMSAVFFLLKGFLSILLNRIVADFVARIEYEQATNRYLGIIRSDLDRLSEFSEKDYLHGLTGSANMAFSQSLLAVSVAFGEVVLLVGISLFLGVTNPLLFTVLALFFVIFGLALNFVVSEGTKKHSKTLESSSLRTANHILDSIQVLRQLQVGGSSQSFSTRFLGFKKSQSLATSEMMLLGLMPRYLTEIVLMVGISFLIFLRGIGVLHDVSPAQLAIFAGGAFRLVASMLPLQGSLSTLKRCEIESRIALALPSDEQKFALGENGPQAWDVEFRDVTYRYSNATAVALKEVSFQISAGQKVAIAGKSGAGKSTIADLLMGVRQPTSGEVTIGGISAKNFIERFPKYVGYMPQKTSIIEGTILENLTLDFEPTAAMRIRAMDVLKKVGLGEFLENLPNGLDTLVGGSNAQLSGGQAQRIGVCRLLMEPRAKILLIDEGTSALDSESQTSVLDMVKDLSPQITVIMIAHSEKVIDSAERVLTVKDGKMKDAATRRLSIDSEIM